MGIQSSINPWDFLASHANIRHTAGKSQLVQDRAPFIVDGGELIGSFNTIGPIWDTASSKITPIKQWDEYDLRISFIPSSSVPTVITFEIDVNGVVITSKSIQPFSLVSSVVLTEDLNFYASANMLKYGGILYVTATEPVELSDKGLKIERPPVFH